ncbi:MAG: hypothetical protein HY235_01410 [Acidobacteria bacterium]|nr:hypothetical protein [Acidobacteriota bacterium]
MSWISVDVVVNSTSWTPVASPFDCDMLVIRNTGGAALRYSPDDGATEDVLDVGAQFSIPVHRLTNWWMSGQPRFAAGGPAVYLKTASGTATIKVTFLR